MNQFKRLETKLMTAASSAGEVAELLTKLQDDELWSEFRSSNQEGASGLDGALEMATAMTTNLEELISHLERLKADVSQILESFQTTRGEIGKPSKKSPGLN